MNVDGGTQAGGPRPEAMLSEGGGRPSGRAERPDSVKIRGMVETGLSRIERSRRNGRCRRGYGCPHAIAPPEFQRRPMTSLTRRRVGSGDSPGTVGAARGRGAPGRSGAGMGKRSSTRCGARARRCSVIARFALTKERDPHVLHARTRRRSHAAGGEIIRGSETMPEPHLHVLSSRTLAEQAASACWRRRIFPDLEAPQQIETTAAPATGGRGLSLRRDVMTLIAQLHRLRAVGISASERADVRSRLFGRSGCAVAPSRDRTLGGSATPARRGLRWAGPDRQVIARSR